MLSLFISSFILYIGWFTVSGVSGATKSPNVLFISLSDIGFGDIGYFNKKNIATANIDRLLSSDESIILGSHYVSYQDSVSFSESITGIYGYHSGFGSLIGSSNIGSHGMFSGIPLGYGLLSEYLSFYGDYDTSFIGTWNLGYSINEQLPLSRGFDYFYGSYTNENDIIFKKSSIIQDRLTKDPSIIRNDNTQYYDFWENENAVEYNNAILKDSNSLFTQKLIEKLKEKQNNNNDNSPFYFHLSFQGPKMYIENENENNGFEYSRDIQDSCKIFLKNEKRRSMCEYMLHLDFQFGEIIDTLKESNNDLWENTLLVVTSNNGGILSDGACNYPYRGGKNTFLDGNTRSVAFVSGGAVSTSNNIGQMLDGLFSNVDWVPTILSFTNVLSNDVRLVREFDGINQKSYLMGDKSIDDTRSYGLRDHILLHISPFGYDNLGVYDESIDSETYSRGWGWTDNDNDDNSVDYKETLNEIAIVFYDDSGKLWKYFVMDDIWDNENKLGTISFEDNLSYNWCLNDNKDGNTDNNYLITNFDFSETYGVLSGLFELTNDKSESENLLTKISQSQFSNLKGIIIEKADFYIRNEYSERASTLYRNLDCFVSRNNIAAYPGSNDAPGMWKPFLSGIEEYSTMLQESCGLSEHHSYYSLHSNKFALTKSDKFTEASYLQSIMHNKQRILKYFTKYTDTYISAAINNGLILKRATKSSDNVPVIDDVNVYSDCIGLESGYYYLQIGFDKTKPIVKALCDNDYMLINYNLDNNWESYFHSWKQAHYKVASPIKTDALDWNGWFLPDSGEHDYDYIISPNCNECNENSLYQVNGKSTTYWENAVNTYCATNERGMPAGDTKWQSYTCRESVYSGIRGKDTHTHQEFVYYSVFVNDWMAMDFNGIDKDVLLTGLSGKNEGKLGTCLTSKLASNSEHFQSVTECEVTDQGNGNLPTIGTNGQYCVCAKETSSSSSSSQEPVITAKAMGDSPQKRELNQLELIVLSYQRLIKEKQDKKLQEELAAEKEAASNAYYLYQSDFTSGTYRIRKEGTYILMEDIVFDYNAPDYDNDEDYSANSVYSDDGDLYWYPKRSQMSEYPGAYQFHDPYLLGFFAGITIESDNVIIDLNSHSLSMDTHYFYQQPWWSHIEIGSQAFVPGEGPSHFGATPQYVKNVEIKNGVLGLTSHHCIHGTAPEASLMSNIVIENIVCKDFVTHGIQLNGFNGLTIENVEIGPNSNMQYLTVDYSQMRTLLPRFEYFADLYENEKTFTFGGKPSKDYILENNIAGQVSLNNEDEFTLRDILDEMILQMDMAFDYVTKRKTEDELHEEYGSKWLQAKRVFVMEAQSGIPYGGVIYGLYLNYPSSGISGFYRNSDKSYDVTVNNVYIHDITHASLEEAYLLKSMRSVFALPIVARLWMGDDGVTGFNDFAPQDDVYYYGTIVYDWLIAYYDALRDDINNVEATNLLYFGDSALSWVSGESSFKGHSLATNYMLTCNGDPMFHSVKGIFGLRLANIKDALLTDIRVENLRELSPIGSDVCGAYERSHDIQQQLPYLYGFTGNNIHGVSVIDSNVLFENLHVSFLNSMTGNATGMTVYPRSTVRFDGKKNEFKNIVGGSQFLFNNMDYDTLSPMLTSPNQMPRGCGIKSENFGHFEGFSVINSMDKGEINEDDSLVNVQCVTGYVGCDDEEMKGWTNFGNEKLDCDTTILLDEIEFGMTLMNEYQTRVPLFQANSKHNNLMKILAINNNNNNGKGKHDTGSNKEETAQDKRIIVVLSGFIVAAVLFAVCSLLHSVYGQSKLQEINAHIKGYQKI